MRPLSSRKKSSLKKLFHNRPLLVVTVSIAAFLVCFVTFEYVRAVLFMKRADDVVVSARVQMLRSDIDRLNKSVNSAPAAQYCQLTASDLLADFNEAYVSSSSGKNAPEKIVEKIRSEAEELGAVPSYRSLLPFAGVVSEAKLRSRDMHQAIKDIRDLTRDDVRSTYCLAVQDALSRIYFAQTLRNPEGVSALLPGQIENFQINTRQALDIMTGLSFPTELSQYHTLLSEALVDLQRTLQRDSNNYVGFSREVDEEVSRVESVLVSIGQRTLDLQDIPTKLALAVAKIK